MRIKSLYPLAVLNAFIQDFSQYSMALWEKLSWEERFSLHFCFVLFGLCVCVVLTEKQSHYLGVKVKKIKVSKL